MFPAYPMEARAVGADDSTTGTFASWCKAHLPALAIVGVSGALLWHLMKRSPPYQPNVSEGSYATNGRGLTKSKLVSKIASQSGVEARDVRAALAGLQEVVKKQLGPGGAGQVTIPGIAKLKRKNVKAKKRRRGVNPFTGEEQWFKAKPATRKVRATILKDVRVAAAKKPRKRS